MLRRSQIYIIGISGIALLGALATSVIVYRGAHLSEERELISRAQTIAYLIDPREIGFLAGNENDFANPFYRNLVSQMKKVRETSKDIRFIYLVGMNERGIFFYLDSEPDGSSEKSPPGQEYGEASDLFKEAFTAGQSRFEGPIADRWGNWISAFIPLRNPENEEVVAVLGVDVNAARYYQRVFSVSSAPLVLALFLLTILFITLRMFQRREELLKLKTEFISIASHELRSPLTGLYWGTQNLLRGSDADKSPALKDTLVLMERTIKSLLDTVAGILDFSRLEYLGSGGLQTAIIDLSVLMRESIDALSLFAQGKEVSISFVSPPPPHTLIMGDKEKIKRAFNNVVSNAIKYSPRGEEVAIKYIRAVEEHIISVRNKGQEISLPKQKNIFSKFFRAYVEDHTSNEGADIRAGTGLGLYFAKQIIESHRGRIWFDSSDAGTEFFIAFPVYHENA